MAVAEGLKALRHPDGQVRVFRPKDNALRFNHSAAVVSMPEVPEELFLEGIEIAVGRNLEFVPPHAPNGLSGSMYVRPLLVSHTASAYTKSAARPALRVAAHYPRPAGHAGADATRLLPLAPPDTSSARARP